MGAGISGIQPIGQHPEKGMDVALSIHQISPTAVIPGWGYYLAFEQIPMKLLGVQLHLYGVWFMQ